jgi:hypothetical protein
MSSLSVVALVSNVSIGFLTIIGTGIVIPYTNSYMGKLVIAMCIEKNSIVRRCDELNEGSPTIPHHQIFVIFPYLQEDKVDE